ncbi:MAG: glycosyltransferase family 2 protein [Acidimicrobiaceae bacterium]|nr:glycosyltransferase family 2 protein [Acidimicrobiaceae bacterium]
MALETIGAAELVRDIVADLTVIVPAFNEAASIGETVKSLLNQTLLPGRVLVVDDCSTDGTGEVAEGLGVEVLRPPSNTGSKAGAQTFALNEVRTRYTMAIDADTVLSAEAIELLASVFVDDNVAAASGFVLPRYVRTLWERGRYVEYMYSFTFHKQVQDYYGKPLISSGCFSMYRTDVLCEVGGWSGRTMAEDMDLTWTFYERGWVVRFVPEASSYPIEPANWHFLGKQLRRWSHGFVQNVRLHWRGLLAQRYLRSVIAIAFFDAVVAPVVTLFAFPVLAIVVSPWFLLAYVIDLPVVAIPVLTGAFGRGESRRALVSLPAYFALRLANCWFMFRAVVAELVVGRRLDVYEKGH